MRLLLPLLDRFAHILPLGETLFAIIHVLLRVRRDLCGTGHSDPIPGCKPEVAYKQDRDIENFHPYTGASLSPADRPTRTQPDSSTLRL